jgi:tetratricopeptide (TPR) repeat protein
MDISRIAVVAALSIVSVGTLSYAYPSHPQNQSPGQSSTQNSDSTQPQSQGESSSSRKGNHKTAHHTTVSEEEAPAPELTKAEDLIQRKNYAEAEPLLHKVVEQDPTNYVAWFDLGFLQNALGRTDDSIAAYRKSVEAKPDVFESNLNLGLQLAKSGHPDAENFLRAATQLTPTSHAAEGHARAWLSLAHITEATKPDEALAAYRHAAALQPKDPEPHLAAGLLLEKQNKFSDAEQEYKQAQSLDPSSTDAAVGLANIYMRGRQLPEADAQLRKVLAVHPDQAQAHIQLARVLEAEGKNDDAIAELQAGAKLTPGDVTLQRELADLYVTAGKPEDAEKAYRALLTEHPQDAEVHQNLGQTLLRQKQFAKAQEELLTAIKLKPDLSSAYGDLAFAASENKDYGLTLKALDARAKSLPEIPTTYFLRASAYDHLRDVKKAVANYQLFLQSANGKYPDQEWQAKHRLIALQSKK